MFKKIILILCLLPLGLSAQNSNKSTIIQAQKAYDQAVYYLTNNQIDAARKELKKATDLDTSFLAAYQQLGDIFRKTKEYSKAIINYKRIIKTDPNFYSLTYLNLAESELNIGDYYNAKINSEKYLQFPTISATSKEKAEKYLLDCNFSLEGIKKPVTFKPINIGPAINSIHDEYLPVQG
jgi:Tfp pilus assembly protein PilF